MYDVADPRSVRLGAETDVGSCAECVNHKGIDNLEQQVPDAPEPSVLQGEISLPEAQASHCVFCAKSCTS